MPSARVVDIAAALIGSRPIKTKIVGVRPGEKTHEILFSEEECHRSIERGNYYVIRPILPEIDSEASSKAVLSDEYSSGSNVLSVEECEKFLREHRLLPDQASDSGELLR